jgi:frataxin-like iron-binding protein CyaY
MLNQELTDSINKWKTGYDIDYDTNANVAIIANRYIRVQ